MNTKEKVAELIDSSIFDEVPEHWRRMKFINLLADTIDALYQERQQKHREALEFILSMLKSSKKLGGLPPEIYTVINYCEEALKEAEHE